MSIFSWFCAAGGLLVCLAFLDALSDYRIPTSNRFTTTLASPVWSPTPKNAPVRSKDRTSRAPVTAVEIGWCPAPGIPLDNRNVSRNLGRNHPIPCPSLVPSRRVAREQVRAREQRANPYEHYREILLVNSLSRGVFSRGRGFESSRPDIALNRMRSTKLFPADSLAL